MAAILGPLVRTQEWLCIKHAQHSRNCIEEINDWETSSLPRIDSCICVSIASLAGNIALQMRNEHSVQRKEIMQGVTLSYNINSRRKRRRMCFQNLTWPYLTHENSLATGHENLARKEHFPLFVLPDFYS